MSCLLTRAALAQVACRTCPLIGSLPVRDLYPREIDPFASPALHISASSWELHHPPAPGFSGGQRSQSRKLPAGSASPVLWPNDEERERPAQRAYKKYSWPRSAPPCRF